jgi:DnaJ like chaperone protein
MVWWQPFALERHPGHSRGVAAVGQTVIVTTGFGHVTVGDPTVAEQVKKRVNMSTFYWLLIGALLYVFFPRDLVPDFLVGWGWLDDLIVLVMLWRYYRRVSRPQRPENRSGQPGGTTDGRQYRNAGSGSPDSLDPHSILGVAPGASKEEIKAAHRRLAAKYHPDKVQHLGNDLQKLAEARFKEIQQAYDELISR